ncbi:hypothetical protein LMH73_009330 [Vibrio splendidus]|nr:hypothetical protein [Vibrio splendidus]MCC4881859.1 hypothetical protein [Vibrio splendidus]
MKKVFVREAVAFNEGDLVEFAHSGERIRFGNAEYRCNWGYGIHDASGLYWGTHNKGDMCLVAKPDSIKEKKVFLTESIEFNEGDLIEILHTGERILFGDAEYQCNWRYRVRDHRGRYLGQLNKGEIKLIKKASAE